jgi:probable phosphoglycerate mutase
MKLKLYSNNKIINIEMLPINIPKQNNNCSSARYLLKFDGCSKGNPGLAGSGAVIYCNNDEIWSKAVFVGKNNTNNEAEYTGLIIGLEEAAQMKINSLQVEGDSLLVIKQMKGEYKVKSEKLMKLYAKAKEYEKMISKIEYNHIYREKNIRADELSNMGLILS